MIPGKDTLSPPSPYSLFVVPRITFSASIRKITICLSLFEKSRFLRFFWGILCPFSRFLYPIFPQASKALTGWWKVRYIHVHTQFLFSPLPLPL